MSPKIRTDASGRLGGAPGGAVSAQQQAKAMKALQDHGLGWWALHQPEATFLSSVIHPEEQIGGVVFGHNVTGSVMLVATDTRIIYLDKKPLFVNVEDVNYDVVSGVTLGWAGPAGTVTLHTRMNDIKIRTFNNEAAVGFRDYVEKRCIEHKNGVWRRV